MTAPQAEPTTRDRLTATALSALGQADFNARLGHVFEHSPWVAEAAWAARPFASLDALHGAMMGAVVAAGPDATLALLRAHPALAAPGPLTPDSVREQGEGLGALGLTEAKTLVESAPKAIKEGVNKAEAEKIKAQIEAAGGTVELK